MKSSRKLTYATPRYKRNVDPLEYSATILGVYASSLIIMHENFWVRSSL